MAFGGVMAMPGARTAAIALVAAAVSSALASCTPRASEGTARIDVPARPADAMPSIPAMSRLSGASYFVLVASEGADRIAHIRFEPGCAAEPCARVVREARIGRNPAEPAGPHGLAVSPDHRHFVVTTAHGFPGGELWKYTLVGDSVKGTVKLGAFPATVQISPDGAYAWVVNFNLHGDMVPSSVSVVYLDEMVEVARIRTCTMPHGSRLTADGSRHYSVCMMDDVLVEIDTKKLGVSRHFMLGVGSERGMSGAPQQHGAMAGANDAGHGMEMPKAEGGGCSPTWAQPVLDGSRIYVACSKSSDVVEIDERSWTLRRRIPMGQGVYNLAITRDGARLVGTNKRGQSVSVVDVASGRELARIPTRRRVPSGVALSTDDRYAFVTVEGIGSEPGTVEIIDLQTLKTVATVDVGQMAGGIDFWKMEPAG